MNLNLNLSAETEAKLRARAQEMGFPLEDLALAVLAEAVAGWSTPRAVGMSVEQFDLELEDLSVNGPSLAGDYSRADIYSDHD